MTIKVLIVDDSKLIREMFAEMLASDSEIEVVGSAIDAYDAREKIKQLNPDVITLDVEMPKMDGISFLEKIMTLRPMPVVMVSTLTQKGADTTIKALELGAVDYVSKPVEKQNEANIFVLRDELIEKVKVAAKAKVRGLKSHEKQEMLRIPVNKDVTKRLIAIGSSTGGVEALREVLIKLPVNVPPIMIVQHMPAKFTKSFADRMNSLCKLQVHEAQDNQKIVAGNVYISPGSKHMTIEKEGISYVCRVKEGENVSGHCPSVDVLFDSVAKIVGDKALGVILTGMGKDGAAGMLKMKQSGCYNIGQDHDSCVVYGMPKEAKNVGATDIEVSLAKMSEEILKRICN